MRANGVPRQPRGAQQREPLTPRQMITNLLPVLLLFAFTILSALPSLFQSTPAPDPHFAFSPSARFNVQRTTAGLGVPYHVNGPEFARHPIGAELARGSADTRTPGLSRFEDIVDRAFAGEKYSQCQRGMESKRRRREREVGLFGIGADWEKVKRIDEETIEACEVLKSKGLMN
jgi:DnaJ family protein B protein 12